MIYVCIAAIALCAATLLAGFSMFKWCARQLERKDRSLERKDEANLELLDRAMVLAGQPWKIPPAQKEHLEETEKAERERLEERRAMWDGVVEDPQPGASYRSRIADIEEMLAEHDEQVWSSERAALAPNADSGDALAAEFFDTAGLEVT